MNNFIFLGNPTVLFSSASAQLIRPFDHQDLAGEVVQNLHEYFRAMYKKVTSTLSGQRLYCCLITLITLQFYKTLNVQLQVTEADIEEFEANYRGSDSEKKDLIDLYKKYKGNMNRYKSNVLASFMKPCQFD